MPEGLQAPGPVQFIPAQYLPSRYIPSRTVSYELAQLIERLVDECIAQGVKLDVIWDGAGQPAVNAISGPPNIYTEKWLDCMLGALVGGSKWVTP